MKTLWFLHVGSSTVSLRAKKYGRTERNGSPHLWLGSYQPLLAFRNCLNFLGYLWVVLDLDRSQYLLHTLWQGLLWLRGCSILPEIVAVCLSAETCLSYLKNNFFLLSSSIQQLAKLEGDIQSLTGKFFKGLLPKLKWNCVTREERKALYPKWNSCKSRPMEIFWFPSWLRIFSLISRAN